MVSVFIAQVEDIKIADLHVFFATAQEKTSAFRVEEEAMRNAMTTMEMGG